MRASVAAAARHARRRELRSLSLESANTSSSSRFNSNHTNRGFYSFLGPTTPAFQQTQEVADSSPSFSGSNTKTTESSNATKTSSTVSQLDFNKLVKQPEGTESPMKFYERLADEGVLQRDEKQGKRCMCLIRFITKSCGKIVVVVVVIVVVAITARRTIQL